MDFYMVKDALLQCYSLLITQLLVMVNDSICYFETYRLINAIIQVISLSSSGIMRIPLERVIDTLLPLLLHLHDHHKSRGQQ